MNSNQINMISNNVNGIQSTKKRTKMIQSFKNKLLPQGILFLQETHSTESNEASWRDEFNASLFFSHGSSNSCGVLIGFLGQFNVNILNQMCDNKGRILILSATIDAKNFLLINLYNPNTENEQVDVLNTLLTMMKTIDINENTNLLLAGDFNVFFNTNLECSGGNPSFKQKSVAKLIEIMETFNLCDIWRIRNPKTKRFTFRQQHCSGFIQRRLDYIFISNSLQESVLNTEVLPAFLSDQSPVFISYNEMRNIPIGPGFWKFNSSLLNNETFKINLRDFIKNTKSKLNFNDTQLNWELLKYEIRKFIISYSKVIAKEERARRLKLENTLKFLENNLTDNLKKQQYGLLKCELDEIYDKIAEGVRVRSRCQQYEEGEKSNKFFLNLEKVRGSQGKVRKLIVSNHEIADPQLIEQEIVFFYKSLFKNNIKKTLSEQTNFLDTLQIPKLSDNACCAKENYLRVSCMML